jgi:hydroxypyruvate reductase
MALGVIDVLGQRDYQALVITKKNYSTSSVFDSCPVTVLEANHPIPDESSLYAGRALIEFIQQSPADAEFIFLISGGASSLVEVLPSGVTAQDLKKMNQWLLASGLSINQINAVRKAMSCIKGGRLATKLDNKKTTVLLISDVPDNDPSVIGSGLLVADSNSNKILATLDLPPWLEKWVKASTSMPPVAADCFKQINVKIISDNRCAQLAAINAAKLLGYAVYSAGELVCGDVEAVSKKITGKLIQGQPGVYIWGAEVTVTLPEHVGRGGRNQQLALCAACELAGHQNILLLAAATDGSDGPTDDAGAIVNGHTIQNGVNKKMNAKDYLRRADAGTFLDSIASLIKTGPTGTNVMDLIIGLKW